MLNCTAEELGVQKTWDPRGRKSRGSLKCFSGKRPNGISNPPPNYHALEEASPGAGSFITAYNFLRSTWYSLLLETVYWTKWTIALI